MVRPVAKLPCFAPPQSFLKRFALRWWQLKCRFASSSAPKLQHFPPTHSSCTIACMHCCTGINLMLSAPNCPVLDAWGILYMQTTRVLLGAYLRPRIRRRALRAPPLDPRTFPNVALRAVRLPLVESGLIVRILFTYSTWPLDCDRSPKKRRMPRGAGRRTSTSFEVIVTSSATGI